MNTLSIEDIRNRVKKSGYEYITHFPWTSNGIKVYFKDSVGYKYTSLLSNIGRSKRTIAYETNVFSKENIDLWIRLNNKSFILDDNAEYINGKYKLPVKCLVCKEAYIMSWKDMYSGQGCPYCSGKRVGNNNSLSALRPDIAIEWSAKNEKSPSDFTAYSKKRAWWKCNNGHEYYATIQGRTSGGNGCPICRESKGEKSVRKLLNDIKLPFKEQYVFAGCKDIKPLKFDFYIPKYNLCIEYQGEQHYKPVVQFGGKESLKTQKRRDRIKDKYCRENGIDLLIIPYWEMKNVATMLHSYFKERKNHGRQKI